MQQVISKPLHEHSLSHVYVHVTLHGIVYQMRDRPMIRRPLMDKIGMTLERTPQNLLIRQQFIMNYEYPRYHVQCC